MITYRAEVQSEHFSYEAYGSGEQAARDALLAGLWEHAGQMGTAETWPDEMIASAKVHAVACGESQFATFELDVIGRRCVLVANDGTIAFRATAETKDPSLGWGIVDGYGTTEAGAREALMAGMAAIANTESENGPTAQAEDVWIYPVREGGAYRGGLTQSLGEPLL